MRGRKWAPVEDRFLELVEKTETCWLWRGYVDVKGRPIHGRIPGSKSSPETAHRRAYRLFVGPIPEGFHVHHVCNNKRCVNPEHLMVLEPGLHKRVHRQHQCRNGHEYTIENTRVVNGVNHCRVCDRERNRRRREADPDFWRAYDRDWKRRMRAAAKSAV